MPKKTPKEIKEFLERGEFLEQLKECDIRGLGPDLLSEGVIDKDEAEDIGFKKRAGEAASNLYMILQRDKSTNKLLALKECLYANTTKGTHKDLADIISEFLGIAVYESTPQSKKMKREDETVRGADDESDNEDDNVPQSKKMKRAENVRGTDDESDNEIDDGQGNPEKVKRFIKEWKILDRLRKCQVSRIAADLRNKGVIDAGEMSSILTGNPRKDADFLYGILDRDKSGNKLRALAEALLNDDTVGNHVDLAMTIYKEYFGESPVSLEHSRESTPQSKKMKREDENIRGANDENDNEDDDNMGDPDVIKEFLGTILNDLKERSNIKDVAQQLHSKKVVKRGQYDRLADAEVEAAGGLLYGFLTGDPSLRKLRYLRDILLEDRGEQNNALGKKIREFLRDPKGYLKLANHSLRQAQKVKTPTNSIDKFLTIDPNWSLEREKAVSFIEKYILTPDVSVKQYQKLTEVLKVNHRALKQIKSSQDKPEIKKADMMKLIKKVIIENEMSLFTVACRIVDSGPKLCRIAFHNSNPNVAMFNSYEHGNPLWQSLKAHLGDSWAQLAKKLGITENEVDALKIKNEMNQDQQLLDFLGQIKIPNLSKDETALLILHMLHSAGLKSVAEMIVKDLGIIIPHKAEKSSTVPQWYQEAKEQQGSIVVRIIRCMFTGSSRVGKTSLKYTLLNRKPRPIKTSTSLIESPTVATVCEGILSEALSKDTLWQEVNEDFLTAVISQAKIESHPQLPTVSEAEVIKPFDTTEVTENRDKSVSVDHLGSSDKAENPEAVAAGDPLSTLHEARQAFLEGSGETEQDIDLKKNITFIYLLDTGGQPSFQDSLPMLVDFPCNFIHVFNASRKLTDPYSNTYCQDGQNEDKPVTENFQSSWEVMQQSLTAAHTMLFNCNHNLALFGGQNPELKIFLVGTNLDNLACSESKKEILQHNIDTVETTNICRPYDQFKVYPENLYEDCNAFFLVDNMLKGETEHSNKVFSELRCRLSDEKSSVKIEVPKLWFCLQLITRNIEKKMWQYSDLRQFCIDCSYVQADNADSQFQALLHLLHSLGFYVYFNTQSTKPENQWVCSDASFLYKEISKLFSIQFPRSSGSIKGNSFKLFKTAGEIMENNCKELFHQLEVHTSIPPLWLLDILEHVGLAAMDTGDDQSNHYFIPVVLPSKNLTSTLPESGSVANLAFTFQYDTESLHEKAYGLPTGIYYRLVVDLASRMKSKTEDGELQSWTKYPKESDRTAVKFYSKKIDSSIYLMQREDRIELQLLVHDYSSPHQSVTTTSLHNLCFMIKKEMVKRICTVSRTLFGDQFLGKKAEIAIGVPCTRPSCVKGNHLMLFLDERAAECLSTQKKTGLLPSQSVWMKKEPDHDVLADRFEFDDESFLSYPTHGQSVDQSETDVKKMSRPTMEQLLPYVSKLSNKLYQLGIVLGVGDYALSLGGTAEDKYLMILRKWLESSVDPTWAKFCTKLKQPGLEMNQLADNIAKEHCP